MATTIAKSKKEKLLQKKIENIGNIEIYTKEVLTFLEKEKNKNGLERIILNRIRDDEEKRDNQLFQHIDEYLEAAMLEAEKLWHSVLLAMKSESFHNTSDDDRIKLFRKNFSKFYDEFTIPARYMICLNQYKRRAFYRYLVQRRNPTQPTGTDMTEQFAELSATYVMYLWVEYQHGAPYKQADAYAIKNQVREKLIKEYTDFNKLYKKTEEKIKKEDVRYKSELTKELLNRLVGGEQSLDDKTMMNIKETIKDKLFRQRFKNVLKELVNRIKLIEPVISGLGKDVEAQKHYDYELKEQEARKNFQKVEV